VVAQFLRLKLQLLSNSFRRSVWQLVGLVIGLVYGLGIALVVVSSLIGLRLAPVDVASSGVIAFGSILVLGFILVPLAFGVDDAMDPRKFSLYGISSSRLASALGVSALISVPSLVVALIALAQIVTWTRGPAVLFALIGAPIILATCVLCARVMTSVAAFLLSTRRSRDATGILGIVLLLVLAPLFVLLLNINWQRDGISVLNSVATFLSWTPLGAVWAAPADAAAGEVGAAFAKEAIAIVFAILLWVAWRYLVQTMLVTQQRIAQAKRYHGLGFFRIVRAKPASVIAARSLTYWVRDARYHVSLLIIPLVPLIMIIPLMVAGVPTNVLALLPVPVMALFLGWSIHNDVAYDNTAIWLHVASGVRGRADRLGRTIPPLLVGIPVLIIASFICAPLFGDESILPALIGVGLGILFSGLGLSSIMSARFPYPAVRPGDSPFAQPQASGSAASIIQSLSFVATFLLASPTLYLAFRALVSGGHWAWDALLVGVVLGAILLGLGILWGGYIFNRRSPELLAFSVRN
jgi:ABC-2 type transport system permease protein